MRHSHAKERANSEHKPPPKPTRQSLTVQAGLNPSFVEKNDVSGDHPLKRVSYAGAGLKAGGSPGVPTATGWEKTCPMRHDFAAGPTPFLVWTTTKK